MLRGYSGHVVLAGERGEHGRIARLAAFLTSLPELSGKEVCCRAAVTFPTAVGWDWQVRANASGQ